MLRRALLVIFFGVLLPVASARAEAGAFPQTLPKNATPKAVAATGDGGTVVAGTFEGPLTIGDVSVPTSGAKDIFLVRYDAGGQMVWVRTLDGPGPDDVADVAVHTDGTIAVAGTFHERLGAANLYIESKESYAYFVAVVEANGDWKWMQAGKNRRYWCHYEDSRHLLVGYAPPCFTQSRATSVGFDRAGNVYVAGGFTGIVTPANSPDLSPTPIYYALGTDANNTNNASLGADNNLTIPTSEKSIVGGGRDLARQAPGGLTSSNVTPGRCKAHGFVEKYRSDGQQVWFKNFGETGGNPLERGGEVIVDFDISPDGVLYAVGEYSRGHYMNDEGATAAIWEDPEPGEEWANQLSSARIATIQRDEILPYDEAGSDPGLRNAFIAKLLATTGSPGEAEQPAWVWVAWLAAAGDNRVTGIVAERDTLYVPLQKAGVSFYTNAAFDDACTAIEINLVFTTLVVRECEPAYANVEADTVALLRVNDSGFAPLLDWYLEMVNLGATPPPFTCDGVAPQTRKLESTGIARALPSGVVMSFDAQGSIGVMDRTGNWYTFVTPCALGSLGYVDDQGTWRWRAGANPIEDTGQYATRLSGVASDASGTFFALGSVSAGDRALVGSAVACAGSTGEECPFVARADITGEWVGLEHWIAGQPIPPPASSLVNASVPPEMAVEGFAPSETAQFVYWSRTEQRLYALRPTVDSEGNVLVTAPDDARRPAVVTLSWHLKNEPPGTMNPPLVVRTGRIVLRPPCDEDTTSDCEQAIVQGAPVDFTGATTQTARLLYTDADAALSNGTVFSAGGIGTSILILNENTATPTVKLIRSTPFEDVEDAMYACRVGTPIVPGPGEHDDPGRNGLVVNDRAPVDMVGPNAAYDRSTRVGPIVPVNAGIVDIAWYEQRDGLAWPARGRRYYCLWPRPGPRQSNGLGAGWERVIIAPDGDRRLRSTRWIPGLATPFTADLFFEANAPPLHPPVPSTGMALSIVKGVPAALAGASADFVGVASFEIQKDQEGAAVLTVTFVDQRSVSHPLPDDEVILELGYVFDGLLAHVQFRIDRVFAAGARPFFFESEWKAPLRISVANQLGSEAFMQERLDPARLGHVEIYHQPDSSLPGYNPNDEHALLANANLCARVQARVRAETPTGPLVLDPGCDTPSQSSAVFALAAPSAQGAAAHVLLKYFDKTVQTWGYRVYRVVAGDGELRLPAVAGQPLVPPYPLSTLARCEETRPVPPPAGQPSAYYEDWTRRAYARAAGTIAVEYFYPLQARFWDPNGRAPGTCVPFLEEAPNDPRDVVYEARWPTDVPTLAIGESLLEPKRGLPDITNQASVSIVYDESNPNGDYTPTPLVQLLDAMSERFVALAGLPSEVRTESSEDGLVLADLPSDLRDRVRYDALGKRLIFRGLVDESGIGDPMILPNVMTRSECRTLRDLASDDAAWRDAVSALYAETRDPHHVRSRVAVPAASCDEPAPGERGDPVMAGFETAPGLLGIQQRKQLGPGGLLSAAFADRPGYVTLAFNDDPSLPGLPISLQVIRVECDLYRGQIESLRPANIFDERLTLRHNGDFGGDPERFLFHWYIQRDETGTSPPAPNPPALGRWEEMVGENGISLTLGSEPPERFLADNWVLVRYEPKPEYPLQGCSAAPSAFAGSPSGTANRPRAQLAEGWIKRVTTNGLNAFDQRYDDFRNSPVNTLVSLIAQAGTRYEGPVALNPDPDRVNRIGLIEGYETVLQRALDLTLRRAVPIAGVGAVNNALLLAAGRIADLYTLLGNEAYADAQDPTIGFTTAGSQFGTAATSVFAFQNQLDSLLDEELALLRGRDDTLSGTSAPPVYNRLLWNFTRGDGEVAYVQNYGIRDQLVDGRQDGRIDEEDARVLFPQGHGDAWGHYLTAQKSYYRLLQDPNYDWEPRAESVGVAGDAVPVDYLDERKFASLAALRARVGAEIVDLTYRREYVEDPAGQWQGYKDTRPERAWGVDEWARRAGKGAYYDWVVANAILPAVDPDPEHEGIQRIDRTTVTSIGEIASSYQLVQSQLDEADRGLNPLGLAKGVVPFDIDPSLVDAGKTHFEQIWERAVQALANAVRIFDFANELANRLRENQDATDDFNRNLAEAERSYTNELIELFGTPFPDDVGPGRTYPTGYMGPDVYHYMIVDRSALLGRPAPPKVRNAQAIFDAVEASGFLEEGGVTEGIPDTSEGFLVEYSINEDDFTIEKPAHWVGRRSAPGEIQEKLSDLLIAQHRFEQALRAWDNRLADIEQKLAEAKGELAFSEKELEIADEAHATKIGLSAAISTLRASQLLHEGLSKFAEKVAETEAVCLPMFMIAGAASGGDTTSVARCERKLVGLGIGEALAGAARVEEVAQSQLELAKDLVGDQAELDIKHANFDLTVLKSAEELKILVRGEPQLRANVHEAAEVVRKAADAYLRTLANAERALAARTAFRTAAAADIGERRYRDAAFRIFRNEAIQKYRSAFDLAGRYAFLAATAYDYETNLLGDAPGSGQRFLTDIVKERHLGAFDFYRNAPEAGHRGLANALARLGENFAVLKGRLGFNNPQTETNRFSLRRELLRLGGTDSDEAWRKALASYRVDNLWEVEAFRRYARPFAPPPDDPRSDPQPGLVIPFSTTIEAGLNFFGEPLQAGDSAYDATNFATKIRSVGIWLENYDCTQLSNTPRVYLLPAGADVLRPPTAGRFDTRSWQVVDQALPVPFPIGAGDFYDDAWIPRMHSLSEPFGEIRRFSSFRAYPIARNSPTSVNVQETTTDSRLIGRSVWNSEWVLVIPGRNLLFDPAEAIDRFLPPGPGEVRPVPTGCETAGVTDIQLFFQTYAISGN